jgi:predicted metal-dependent enzyme (double-stranded beta helix superfamily)
MANSDSDSDLVFGIPGQATLLFAAESPAESPTPSCSFTVSDSGKTDGLLVKWGDSGVAVRRLTEPAPYPGQNTGGAPASARWFSLDAQNQRLLAGVGEARFETCVYLYSFPAATDAERRANKKFLESLVSVGAFAAAAPQRLLRDPVARALPHRVAPTATLDALAAGLYMPASHLSPVARQMYDCVAACQLDTDDFPEFSQAIAQSIAGGWCARRLAEKADEFGKPNPDETYLRITLGENSGESPGIPYVLEIWPAGHYSPVHSHAGAEAIIKVLHGDIRVGLYPYLGPGAAPFATADFTAGDVMWISPTLNQTHQLRNCGARPCMTIQCYMYDAADRRHYDYFDYLDEGAVKQYEPDSDMEFSSFKSLMRTEWESRRPTGCFACFGTWRRPS